MRTAVGLFIFRRKPKLGNKAPSVELMAGVLARAAAS